MPTTPVLLRAVRRWQSQYVRSPWTDFRNIVEYETRCLHPSHQKIILREAVHWWSRLGRGFTDQEKALLPKEWD